MAKSKRSAPKRKPTSPPAPSKARRPSAPQSPATHKSDPPIHYEIDTEYGRLICDYDISTALASDEQGNAVAAVVKAIRGRFEEDLVTIPKRPELASWVEAHAQRNGTSSE